MITDQSPIDFRGLSLSQATGLSSLRQSLLVCNKIIIFFIAEPLQLIEKCLPLMVPSSYKIH